jgi:hypothetical protein
MVNGNDFRILEFATPDGTIFLKITIDDLVNDRNYSSSEKIFYDCTKIKIESVIDLEDNNDEHDFEIVRKQFENESDEEYEKMKYTKIT